MSGPIKPSEVASKKVIPEEVFTVFNALIAESWDGGSASVRQDQAAAMVANALGTSTVEVYRRHLLDVEDAYRMAGWAVEYEKPGYCEDGSAYFHFRRSV